MTTPRNRAIYKAKQDFATMRTHGRPGGLIRLDTEDGARWSYTDSESDYIVILKHAADYRELGGAVDAKRTQLANIERMLSASRARREAAAKAEEPAPVDPAAGLDMGVELITEARPVRIAGGIAESGMTEEPAPAEEPKPAPAAVRYIDATPTWAAILPALLAAVTDGTTEGQRIARAELVRMARAADSAVAAAKAEEEKAKEPAPALTPFTYRVALASAPSAALVSGSGRIARPDWSDMVRLVMARAGVTIERQDMGAAPPMFHFARNGRRVFLSISPAAESLVAAPN